MGRGVIQQSATGRQMTNNQKTTVLVVDDHPVVRMGVAAIIDAQRDMRVCADVGTGEEAVEMFKKHRPDITLMDLRLPKMSGLEALRIIRGLDPHARSIVLTTYEGDEDIHQAIAAGALGYIIKGMPEETLVDALRKVRSGMRFLPPPVMRSLDDRTPNSDLSPREREVLSLMVRGMTNQEIADALGIARATVKCHVAVIFLQLGVSDRTHAVVEALHRGLEHI
jgi:two-component system, NarL family, response regulator